MRKFSMVINDWYYIDLKEYLEGLIGVENATINSIEGNFEVIISYDESKININILKLEIIAFNNYYDIFRINAFDKYSNKILLEKELIVKDICCEYCFWGMMKELLDTEGIECAYSNFDYINSCDVSIYIKYDNDIISEDKVIELENKFNYIES